MTTKHVEDWFLKRGLPFNKAVSDGLLEQGVKNVELLKLVPDDVFLSWFADSAPVEQRLARVVFAKLKKEEFDEFKTATNLNLVDDSPKPSPPKKSKKTNSSNNKAEKQKEFYVKSNQTKAARKEADITSRIVYAYNCNGHQTNELRLLLAKALRQGNTQASLVRSIRLRAAGYAKKEWDGKVKKCKIAKQIKSVIGRIKENLDKGKLDHLFEEKADLKSKTVKPNTRGRKTVDITKQVEDKL